MKARPLAYRAPLKAGEMVGRRMLNGYSNYLSSPKIPPSRQISKNANALYKLHVTRLSVPIKQAAMPCHMAVMHI